MKKILFASLFCYTVAQVQAQTYPQPEFSNEIYLLKKESAYTVIRLEKNTSKMETKTKLGGMGGAETGYPFDGAASTVRLQSGKNLSFVFTTSNAVSTSSNSDSILRANGMDPSLMAAFTGSDPAKNLTLYKVESAKGQRKIIYQKNGGMFSGGKIKSSDKYSFSVKNIRDGYWELVIDKTLPKGEYAFTATTMADAGGMAGLTIFAFGVD